MNARALLRSPRWFLPLGLAAIAIGAAALVGLSGRPASSPVMATPTPGRFLEQGYAELAKEPGVSTAASGSLWDLFSAMLLPTLVVLVAVYATIRLLRYLNRRVAATVAPSHFLEVVATLPIAGSGVLHVVRVGERYLLIGAGSGGVSLLSELQPEEVAQLRAERERSPLARAVVPPFRELVRARLPRSWTILDNPPADSPSREPAARFGHVPE